MIPVKRTEILYSRIKKQNKQFIKKEAKKAGISEAEYVDYVFDAFRLTDAGNKKKSRKSS